MPGRLRGGTRRTRVGAGLSNMRGGAGLSNGRTSHHELPALATDQATTVAIATVSNAL